MFSRFNWLIAFAKVANDLKVRQRFRNDLPYFYSTNWQWVFICNRLYGISNSHLRPCTLHVRMRDSKQTINYSLSMSAQLILCEIWIIYLFVALYHVCIKLSRLKNHLIYSALLACKWISSFRMIHPKYVLNCAHFKQLKFVNRVLNKFYDISIT